ncbi:MAG TPA: sulfatase-like hydrolase/transferase [Verrucomicrobiae bacterium]|nr:sulfatase-like hydrolase/transferase [Verrucomicrobiae bacterium]
MRHLLFFLLAESLLSGAVHAAPPNILFLLTDDQRFDAVGALGHPVLKTPNIDSLARSGHVFRNAYTLGANVGAVCTPSRNMLQIGKAYFRYEGIHAKPDGHTMPEVFNAAGYETYYYGKKGNTAPLVEAKFEHSQALANNDLEHVGGEPGKCIVDAAIEFLRSRDRKRPLFMQLAWPNPHDPRTAAEKYMAMYRRDEIPLPKNYMPQHPFDNGEMAVRDERLAPWPRSEDEIRRHLHEYYATISGLDFHIGRLLAVLKEVGLAENTIIIFASDNGLAIGSHGLMGKQNVYEDGLKVPLIFSGPGIPKGESAALVYLLDLFPTFCDLAGLPAPEGIDGRSLKPVIVGTAKGVRDTLFLSYKNVQRALRDDRWKLIRYPLINRAQLFDLASDPYEMRDLAGDLAQADRIAKMMGALREWQQRLGDPDPLEVADTKTGAWTPPGPEEPKAKRPRKAKGSGGQ